MKRREEKEVWATELVKQLEKEKKLRVKLEEERRALAAFVSKFDALGLGVGSLLPASSVPASASASMGSGRVKSYLSKIGIGSGGLGVVAEESPMRIDLKNQPSLLDQTPEEEWSMMEDVSFEVEIGKGKLVSGRRAESQLKEVLGRKENIPV